MHSPDSGSLGSQHEHCSFIIIDAEESKLSVNSGGKFSKLQSTKIIIANLSFYQKLSCAFSDVFPKCPNLDAHIKVLSVI